MRLKLIRTIQRSQRVSRKVSANLVGSGGSLKTLHQRLGKFGPPHLGALSGLVGSAEGLVVFDQ